jgi:putrescine transport system ATP-binding protein
VSVAVRPEKVQIETAASGVSAENCFAGCVTEVGYLGGVSIYKVRLDNGLDMKATVANRTRIIERPIGAGDRVWLSFAPEAGVVLLR